MAFFNRLSDEEKRSQVRIALKSYRISMDLVNRAMDKLDEALRAQSPQLVLDLGYEKVRDAKEKMNKAKAMYEALAKKHGAVLTAEDLAE